MGGIFSKQSLKFELIAIYEDFLRDNYDKSLSSDSYKASLRKRAQEVYDKSSGAGIIFGEPFETAINGIEHLGWNFPKPNSNKPWILTKKEAKKILEELKKV